MFEIGECIDAPPVVTPNPALPDGGDRFGVEVMVFGPAPPLDGDEI